LCWKREFLRELRIEFTILSFLKKEKEKYNPEQSTAQHNLRALPKKYNNLEDLRVKFPIILRRVTKP
jgi:hypothetical protein